ncbi:hypothetical protein H4R33_001767 [Dimargaris cristalligena]|nr:hypothetical protein H4R33_001767 [Dimargaris cristalligena]
MGRFTMKHLTTPMAAFTMAIVVTLVTRHAIGIGQRERQRKIDIIKGTAASGEAATFSNNHESGKNPPIV